MHTGSVRRTRRSMRREDGASAVEFALIAPILIMLVFGIIYFGIVLADVLAANNAARQGARFGVVAQRTCADIATEVQSSMGNALAVKWPVTMNVTRTGSLNPICGGVAIPKTGPAGGTTIQACAGSDINKDTLQVVLTTSTGVFIPFALSNSTFPIKGTGVYRCEYA